MISKMLCDKPSNLSRCTFPFAKKTARTQFFENGFLTLILIENILQFLQQNQTICSFYLLLSLCI